MVEQNGTITPSISAASSTTTPTSGRPATTGRSRRFSTATRSAAGRCWPIRAGISTPRSTRYRTGYKLPLDADCLGPRFAHRRADRALHGRDRHVQLLHGAGRSDRGAGAEAGLPADRRRRIPPFQAVLRPHAAAIWRARSSACSPACASPPAASPSPRMTSWPTPFIAATTRRAWPTTTGAASPATWARAMSFYQWSHIERSTGHGAQGGRPAAARPARRRRRQTRLDADAAPPQTFEKTLDLPHAALRSHLVPRRGRHRHAVGWFNRPRESLVGRRPPRHATARPPSRIQSPGLPKDPA